MVRDFWYKFNFSIAIWKNILWLDLSYEHPYDTDRMVVKET